MIRLELLEGSLHNVSKVALTKDFPEYDLIRQIERYSIREYMRSQAHLMMTGNILDFGSGTQPYRSLVKGNYWPLEKGEPFPDILFDVIMCNQVLQYIEDVPSLLCTFYNHIKEGGYLIMTGGTNWPEVEEDDIARHTRSGIKRLLIKAGFDVLRCQVRSELLMLRHFNFSLGWNVLAQRVL
jgi:SAM-dependent methyltransferase